MFIKIKPVVGSLTDKEKRTMIFAAQELSKHLAMVDSFGDFPVIPVKEYTEKADDSLYLFIGCACLPKVEDPYYDDAICVKTRGLSGVISGTNARAVLIGAYRFLKENGFDFIKPGSHGTHVPETFLMKELSIVEAASYRHRGLCFEGTMYEEAFGELLDWLPKVGMNAYFIQYLGIHEHMNRHYGVFKGYTLTGEEADGMYEMICDEIEKRSLLYHAVGHGWTGSVFGCDRNYVRKVPEHIPEELVSLIAQIDGKREVFCNNPINTNLCYSNPKVQEIMTDMICNYCKENPIVDYIHFWVADGGSNYCECEECQKLRSSDYYIQMMNLLDEKLTAAGLKTKVVFLIYSGLIWAPSKERIKNPERFSMMWAPFIRWFTHPITKDMLTSHPGFPYDLNHRQFHNLPDIYRDIDGHLSFYREWRETFDGDSFDFDYHLCQEGTFDLSGYRLARTIHDDCAIFKEIGMNGLVDCQVQRIFLPTALCMYTQAATLWNRDLSYDEICEYVFKTQFGEDYKAVWDYLSELSKYEVARAVHGVEDMKSPENKEKLKKSIEIIRAFREKYADKVAAMPEGNRKHDWEGLLFYGECHEGMYRYYGADSKAEMDAMEKEYYAICDSKQAQFKIEYDRPTMTLITPESMLGFGYESDVR